MIVLSAATIFVRFPSRVNVAEPCWTCSPCGAAKRSVAVNPQVSSATPAPAHAYLPRLRPTTPPRDQGLTLQSERLIRVS